MSLKKSAANMSSSQDKKSEESIGMGVGLTNMPPVEDYRSQLCRINFVSLLPVSGSSVIYKDFNSIVIFCYCISHRKVALSKCQNAGVGCEFYSLPYTAYDEAHSLRTIMEICIMSLLPGSDSTIETKPTSNSIRVFPPTLKHQVLRESHCLFLDRTFKRLLVLLAIPEKYPDCCLTHDSITWRTIDDIINETKDDIFCGELKHLSCHIMTHLQNKPDLTTVMYDFIYESISHENSWDLSKNEDALLSECGITQDQCRIYFEDYHEHLYPSLIMSKISFFSLLIKYQLIKNVNSNMQQDMRLQELWIYVTAFINKKQELLNFQNYLIIMILLDKNCPTNNIYRIKAIYDYQILKNKLMNSSKIYCLSLNKTDIDCVIEKYMIGDIKSLTINKFSEYDMSFYFRFDENYFGIVQTGIIKHLQNNRIISRGYHKIYHQSIPIKMERCVKHRIKKYTWAKQSITMNEYGQSSNPVPEPELPGVPDEKTRMMNEFSLEILFNMQSLTNLLLRNITNNMIFSSEILISSSVQIFKDAIDFQMIHELFQQVLVIFASEPQILQMSVPTTIIGSPSGSIFDVLQFEKTFFPAQYHVTSNYIFLGNYTSQLFEYPLETLVYLFALKCQLPNHIFLLRGVNEMKTNNFLMTQLVSQYGLNRSSILFQQLFQIFEFLPYAAIINDKIFAVHSGIPILKRPLLDILRSTATTAARREEIFFQMIYNVPAQFSIKDAKEIALNNAMTGFQPRTEKNVSGYYYNHRATFRFLKLNGFERIIRSCNPCREGFATMFQNGVITVSSASIKSADFTAQYVGIIKLDSSKFKHKILIMRLEALSQKQTQTG